ncbi:hypothetical protein H0H92_003954 [Tricholoma furcatifolium]|nr:hypothetical protein H0H92_003954 [Tricholoma furcatifolium]
MSLLILSSTDVDNVLASIYPSEFQNLMARVFNLISTPPQSPPMIDMPHRLAIPMRNHRVLFMPARAAHPDLRGTTLKVVSVPQNSGDARGLPASTMVLDENTGAVKALVNARSLTAFRSLLSSNIVRLQPTSVVAFGAGKQIDAHLELHFRFFPTLTKCTIVNRTPDRANLLVDRLRARFPSVSITGLGLNDGLELQKAVSNASLIICATPSTEPLFPASWVSARTHVVLVGSYTPAMREVERALILRALGDPSRLLVDSKEACAIEAGELIDAGLRSEDVREIGECVRYEESGALVIDFVEAIEDKGVLNPITMFKSVGVGLQDVAIACAVVERAEKMGLGTRVPNYDG